MFVNEKRLMTCCDNTDVQSFLIHTNQ